ncbi:hypothetical protein DICVIV_07718 [Dictyocaulus viviparus]|uniref:Uncharacterized protein n=1 Tax=Dictyocaulus viviparus TaxID=29172 RepID=A0A0D8XR20_DICVI|nr:hypothetical protein DICVIV_07718 [Dictyocaulus viviparus]
MSHITRRLSQVALVFYNNWYKMVKDKNEGTLRNAIIFDKIGSTPADYNMSWNTWFQYKVAFRGNATNFKTLSFNMKSSEFEFFYNTQVVHTKHTLKSGDVYFNTMKLSYDVENFALFSTHMRKCPTIITQVNRSFPFWIPGHKIPLTGIRAHEESDTTTLRDVIIAVMFIVIYYAILVNILLPIYFGRLMQSVRY